jgi:hypothetical protein
MAGLVTLILMNLLDFGEEGAHLELKPQHWSILELWCDCNCLIVARATLGTSKCQGNEASPAGGLPGMLRLRAERDNKTSRGHCPWQGRSLSENTET